MSSILFLITELANHSFLHVRSGAFLSGGQQHLSYEAGRSATLEPLLGRRRILIPI